jgi:hypothetical protein
MRTQHFGDAAGHSGMGIGSGQHFYDLYVQYKVYYSPGFQVRYELQAIRRIGTQDNFDSDGCLLQSVGGELHDHLCLVGRRATG